jgi:hypothetical protein
MNANGSARWSAVPEPVYIDASIRVSYSSPASPPSSISAAASAVIDSLTLNSHKDHTMKPSWGQLGIYSAKANFIVAIFRFTC